MAGIVAAARGYTAPHVDPVGSAGSGSAAVEMALARCGQRCRVRGPPPGRRTRQASAACQPLGQIPTWWRPTASATESAAILIHWGWLARSGCCRTRRGRRRRCGRWCSSPPTLCRHRRHRLPERWCTPMTGPARRVRWPRHGCIAAGTCLPTSSRTRGAWPYWAAEPRTRWTCWRRWCHAGRARAHLRPARACWTLLRVEAQPIWRPSSAAWPERPLNQKAAHGPRTGRAEAAAAAGAGRAEAAGARCRAWAAAWRVAGSTAGGLDGAGQPPGGRWRRPKSGCTCRRRPPVPLHCQRCLQTLDRGAGVDRRFLLRARRGRSRGLDEEIEDDVLVLPARLDLRSCWKTN